MHSLAWLPDGFCVRRLARTGLSVVDNFCSAEEAAAVIAAAQGRLKRSVVLEEGKWKDDPGRVSEHAHLYNDELQHPAVVPLLMRAAMLTGMPYTWVENVYATRYGEGGLYNEHLDFGDEYPVDRYYTVLLYLNSLPDDQGGATVFPRLNVAVRPRVGRAVSWTNKNPDGSGHMENSHAAYPVTNGGEKWVIQFWFHRHPMVKPLADLAAPQVSSGVPLEETDALPDGVSLHRA